MKRCGKKKFTITVGITGTQTQVGVTHLAIMLANYLSSKERCRVAVVDFSKKQSLLLLQEIYEECDMRQKTEVCFDNTFCIHGVDYFSRATQRDIANILQLGYEYVVMDFGGLNWENSEYEILRCHKRILVGSCCEWQQKAFFQVMDNLRMSQDNGKWCYAAFLGIQEIRHKLEKLYRIHIHKIPYEEDPFCLSRNHFDSLRIMLQEEAECL